MGRSENNCNLFNKKCCITNNYNKLTMDEKTFIQLGLTTELKQTQLPLEMTRSTSTITRELKRNGWVPTVKSALRADPLFVGDTRQ